MGPVADTDQLPLHTAKIPFHDHHPTSDRQGARVDSHLVWDTLHDPPKIFHLFIRNHKHRAGSAIPDIIKRHPILIGRSTSPFFGGPHENQIPDHGHLDTQTPQPKLPYHATSGHVAFDPEFRQSGTDGELLTVFHPRNEPTGLIMNRFFRQNRKNKYTSKCASRFGPGNIQPSKPLVPLRTAEWEPTLFSECKDRQNAVNNASPFLFFTLLYYRRNRGRMKLR